MAAFTGTEAKQIDKRPGPQSEAPAGGTEEVEVKQEVLDEIETPEDAAIEEVPGAGKATTTEEPMEQVGRGKTPEEAKTSGVEPASRPEFEAAKEKPSKGETSVKETSVKETSVAPSINESEEYSTGGVEIVCTCSVLEPPKPRSGPTKKIEITQTEITTVERIQVVTQTAEDVATQTLPGPGTFRQTEPPRIVTTTRTLDADSEMLNRILGTRFPQSEQAAATTCKAHSPERKTVAALQTSFRKAAPAAKRFDGPRFGPEKEIRSVYYGKKPGDVDEGRCTCSCCQCGRTVSTGLQTSGTNIACQESDDFFKFVSTFPSRKKAACYTTMDQWDQHETVCPDCRVKKLQEAIKCHATPMKPNAKVTRDQEICTCPPPTRDRKLKQKSDRSCMARIPKGKADRIPRKGTATKNIDDQCPCTANVETGVPGVVKRMRCACGEVD